MILTFNFLGGARKSTTFLRAQKQELCKSLNCISVIRMMQPVQFCWRASNENELTVKISWGQVTRMMFLFQFGDGK
jgi:hypothetical protein